MKYFSMFSGIGGFEYGIQCAFNKQSAKIEQDRQRGDRAADQVEHNVLSTSRTAPLCIGYSEIDKYAIQIYNKQFKGHKNYGDCTEIKWQDVPDFDLLVGGFPCQSFSIAGKRGGFDDTRGTLFFEIARCLREKQPRLFLIENVKGLLSHDKGNTFLTILTTLDELGYDIQWQVLNSKNFGVPQNRERVFIIGHLRGTSRPEVFPIGGTNTKDNETDTIGVPLRNLNRNGKTWDKNHFFTAQTSTGCKNGIIKDSKIRRLTPTECERLQGFPDGWTEGISDTQRYKCLGNAVTTNVIETIIKKVVGE